MIECYIIAVALSLYEDGALDLQGGGSIHDFHDIDQFIDFNPQGQLLCNQSIHCRVRQPSRLTVSKIKCCRRPPHGRLKQ
jgi:hypothetical protein